MYISIVCVFSSLIPACISDYKSRIVEPEIWRRAAFIGIPIGIVAFCMKLVYNEIVIPSLIISIAEVLAVIGITTLLATKRDPTYKPQFCERCGSSLSTTIERITCPRCEYNNSKSILGGADMIAISIIMLTSFYISGVFVPTFIFAFMLSCGVTIFYLYLKSKDSMYRVPLILPITSAYILTVILSFLNIDALAYILP